MEYLIMNRDMAIMNDTTLISSARFDRIHEKLQYYKESKTFAKYHPSGTPIHQINCKDYDTVYVTSDIHADFRKFVQTMANNGLVALPKNGEATLDPYSENIYDLRLLTDTLWTGGSKTLFVVVGDLVDGYRGGNVSEVDDPYGSFEILMHIFIHNMRIKAQAQQSDILFTFGNHDVDSVIINDEDLYSNMYTKYVHPSAKIYYFGSIRGIDNMIRSRREALLPFYMACPLFFIQFQHDGKTEIVCVHAGIHNPRYEDQSSMLDKVQRTLYEGSDIQKAIRTVYREKENVLWTRQYETDINTACEHMKTSPLVIVGHCPTPLFDNDKKTPADKKKPFGISEKGYKSGIYQGCDYSSNGENLRGCVMIGCTHNNDPKLIFVDTASSQAFRFNESLYGDETYYFLKSDLFDNKDRQVEILKMTPKDLIKGGGSESMLTSFFPSFLKRLTNSSHTSPTPDTPSKSPTPDTQSELYYKVERVINGKAYDFNKSIEEQNTSEPALEAELVLAQGGRKKGTKRKQSKRRTKKRKQSKKRT